MSAQAHPLLGARLRRVDAPFPDLLALTLSNHELRGALLIGLSQGARGVGFAPQRPPGSEKTPFLLRARKCLERGRVTAIEWSEPRSLRLTVERAELSHTLVAELHGAHGNAWLLAPDGAVIAALHADGAPVPAAPARATQLPDLAALRASGERLLAERGITAIEGRKALLARALRSAEKKLARRLAAVEADRARADQVGALRHKASLVLAQLHALPKGGAAVELLDTTRDPPERVTLEIDPKLGPRRQADAWFHAARRLERGAAVAAARAEQTRAELAAVAQLFEQLNAAKDEAEIAAVAERGDKLGIDVPIAAAEPGAAPVRRGPKPRLPYRRFVGSGERAILVGRGADDNDRLTLDHARPHDLWLHARDEAGAHVVIPLEKGEACPSELLCDAATLAAHFSQARGQARVDVSYVERRYIRKPRKSPAGQVLLDREKVFRLELQPARLSRLLAAERSGGSF